MSLILYKHPGPEGRFDGTASRVASRGITPSMIVFIIHNHALKAIPQNAPAVQKLDSYAQLTGMLPGFIHAVILGHSALFVRCERGRNCLY